MLLDERLFTQQVTVYRLLSKHVSRQVLSGCYFHTESCLEPHVTGNRVRKDFMLVVPGPQQPLMPGDLVYLGEGPIVTDDMWQDFIPATVPELVQVEYVQPVYFRGALHHTEAGSLRKVWR